MTALKNDNYFETIELLTNKQRDSIKNNKKDYIVLDVRGNEIELSLTNQFPTKKFIDGEVTVFDNDHFEELVDNYEQTGKKFYLTR